MWSRSSAPAPISLEMNPSQSSNTEQNKAKLLGEAPGAKKSKNPRRNRCPQAEQGDQLAAGQEYRGKIPSVFSCFGENFLRDGKLGAGIWN